MNWIFAAYSGCKNPVQTEKKNQTQNFKLENVKNQVQIDKASGMLLGPFQVQG